MSICKNYADQTTTFTCDACGETFEADGLDFYDAIDEFEDHGGTSSLHDGVWHHFCEHCE